MNLRVLVLGASGQLGSRLAEAMEELGFYVQRVSTSQDNKAFLSWSHVFNSRFQERFDVVINSASPNSAYAENDSRGFCNWMAAHGRQLINLATKVNARQIVSVSTTRVYGSTPRVECVESSAVQVTASPYANGHLELESILLEDNRTAILRVANSFGPAGMFGKLDNALLKNQLASSVSPNSSHFKLHSPEAWKDFVTASDVVRAAGFIVKRCIPGIFNVSSGKLTNLGEWADLVTCPAHLRASRWQQIKLAQNERDDPFSFSNRKLIKEGFVFENEVARELDSLIISLQGERSIP